MHLVIWDNVAFDAVNTCLVQLVHFADLVCRKYTGDSTKSLAACACTLLVSTVLCNWMDTQWHVDFC